MDTATLGLYVMLIACAAALTAWIIVLIYRGTLEAREDDQIFLDKAEEAMAREQRALVVRIEKLSSVVHTLLVLWIVLGVASAGLWIWLGLRQNPG